MERIVKGIWFPIEIWEADDLSWSEKILLLEIDSFTSQGKDCFISDENNQPVAILEFQNANTISVKEHCNNEYFMPELF